MSSDFYKVSILPYSGIIIKICRAYTNSQEDFEDYYQEVCLQIWRSKDSFKEQSEWSTWIYRLSLNVCLTLLKKKKNNKQHQTSDYLPPEAIEDSRVFTDESLNQLYDAIKKLGGTVIRIYRDLPHLKKDTHVSEQELKSIPSDHTIYNNGTIPEYYKCIEELFNTL